MNVATAGPVFAGQSEFKDPGLGGHRRREDMPAGVGRIGTNDVDHEDRIRDGLGALDANEEIEAGARLRPRAQDRLAPRVLGAAEILPDMIERIRVAPLWPDADQRYVGGESKRTESEEKGGEQEPAHSRDVAQTSRPVQAGAAHHRTSRTR